MKETEKKSIEIAKMLDQLSLMAGYGITRGAAIKKNICVKCKKKILGFKDEISKKEYKLTAWCQECQNEFFK